MNAIVTFESKVKERIKSIVADLIPDERWDEIVKATVLEFERSDLPKLIKAELTEQYKNAIIAEFAKPEWQLKWTYDGKMAASEAVNKLLVEAAPIVLSAMIGGAMQQAMQQLQYAIQNQR